MLVIKVVINVKMAQVDKAKVNSPLNGSIFYFIFLTSVSPRSPGLFRQTRAPDNRSSSRFEGIHIGVWSLLVALLENYC